MGHKEFIVSVSSHSYLLSEPRLENMWLDFCSLLFTLENEARWRVNGKRKPEFYFFSLGNVFRDRRMKVERDKLLIMLHFGVNPLGSIKPTCIKSYSVWNENRVTSIKFKMRPYLVRLASTLECTSNILEEETGLRSSWSKRSPLHDTHFIHANLRFGKAGKGY